MNDAPVSVGLTPYYSEACPAALTSLYVGGRHQPPLTKEDIERNSRMINVVSVAFWNKFNAPHGKCL